MSAAKTISITLPAEELSRAEKLAEKENRTMSELVGEALRQYERKNWWSEINAYGRTSAEAAGVRTEEEVVNVIREVRASRRPPSE